MRTDPPLLVLGLGNPLLRDDGAGLALLREVEAAFGNDERLDVVDGGTQGIALLGLLEGRRALLVLDAVALGAAPGTLHVLCGAEACSSSAGRTAHEGNASTLLATASLLGQLPERIIVVGIEPAEVRTGVGLSEPVRRALDAAASEARRAIAVLLADVEEPCTS